MLLPALLVVTLGACLDLLVPGLPVAEAVLLSPLPRAPTVMHAPALSPLVAWPVPRSLLRLPALSEDLLGPLASAAEDLFKSSTDALRALGTAGWAEWADPWPADWQPVPDWQPPAWSPGLLRLVQQDLTRLSDTLEASIDAQVPDVIHEYVAARLPLVQWAGASLLRRILTAPAHIPPADVPASAAAGRPAAAGQPVDNSATHSAVIVPPVGLVQGSLAAVGLRVPSLGLSVPVAVPPLREAVAPLTREARDLVLSCLVFSPIRVCRVALYHVAYAVCSRFFPLRKRRVTPGGPAHTSTPWLSVLLDDLVDAIDRTAPKRAAAARRSQQRIARAARLSAAARASAGGQAEGGSGIIQSPGFSGITRWGGFGAGAALAIRGLGGAVGMVAGAAERRRKAAMRTRVK
jgi:hypothetical protein